VELPRRHVLFDWYVWAKTTAFIIRMMKNINIALIMEGEE
jgi:hypothetical protein